MKHYFGQPALCFLITGGTIFRKNKTGEIHLKQNKKIVEYEVLLPLS